MPNVIKLRSRATWHDPFIARYHALLRRFPVEAIFAGHFHRDELHFVAGRALLICPALSAKYALVPSIRVVTHDARGLRYRQVYIGPRSGGRSYLMDLRGWDEEILRKEILDLDGPALTHLIARRYTGPGRGSRRLRGLSMEHKRQFLLGIPLGEPWHATRAAPPSAWQEAVHMAPDASPSYEDPPMGLD